MILQGPGTTEARYGPAGFKGYKGDSGRPGNDLMNFLNIMYLTVICSSNKYSNWIICYFDKNAACNSRVQ